MSKKKKKKKKKSSPAKQSSSVQYEGLILSVLGKGYYVDIEGEEWLCRVRGRLFVENKFAHPVVGDRVIVEPMDEEKTGIVKKILPRTSVLQRKYPERELEQVLAANIDQVLIFSALWNPDFCPNLVDRYLLTCEANKLEAIIVVNKIDYAEDDDIELAIEEFEYIGYKTLAISAKTGEGIDALKSALKGKKSIVTGPSGAGKSTTMNALFPSLNLPTNQVNLVTGKGKHTTTVTKLFPVEGGHVMDSPGIREFGLWGIRSETLELLYPEFEEYLGQCQFRDCKHLVEPNCAIRQAVEEYKISDRRYENYEEIRFELEEKEKNYKLQRR